MKYVLIVFAILIIPKLIIKLGERIMMMRCQVVVDIVYDAVNKMHVRVPRCLECKYMNNCYRYKQYMHNMFAE